MKNLDMDTHRPFWKDPIRGIIQKKKLQWHTAASAACCKNILTTMYTPFLQHEPVERITQHPCFTHRDYPPFVMKLKSTTSTVVYGRTEIVGKNRCVHVILPHNSSLSNPSFKPFTL
jgi:hypothetical protein